jgi:hypothetical protein
MRNHIGFSVNYLLFSLNQLSDKNRGKIPPPADLHPQQNKAMLMAR